MEGFKSKIVVWGTIGIICLLLAGGLIPAFAQQATEGIPSQQGPEATVVKTVDKDVAYVGDTLHYTIVFSLTYHPTPTMSVYVAFTDVIPLGTEYISGSVSGASFDGTKVYTDVMLDLDSGTPGTLPGHLVNFDVRIVSRPPSGQIVNWAIIGDKVQPLPPGSLPWASDDAVTSVHVRLFLPLVTKAFASP